MADKKVQRSFRERPLTPKQKMKGSLSDQGTVSMAEPTHDKGRSALLDRFREREDRFRREQALRARETTGEPQEEQETATEGDSAGPVEPEDRTGGGDS